MPNSKRINSILYKEISNIIQFDLTNSNIGFVTVSEVNVSKDLNNADVYVSVFGKGYEKKDTLEALRKSKGYIKTELSKRLQMRKIPDLNFIIDDSLDTSFKIDSIIAKNSKED